MGLNGAFGRVLYGASFCVVLPWLLVLWATHAQLVVTWPLPAPPAVGWALVGAGAALMAWAMLALWRDGGGLPMNAFPPPRFVGTGPYALVAHPIYVGFAFVCFGVALAAGSAVGFYLVAPVAALGAVALVVGFEAPALRARFPAARTRPLLSLPDREHELRPRDRLAVLLLVLLPWLVLYLWVVEIGPSRDAVAAWLPGEADWPVLPWTYPIYASAYVVVGTAPLWARGAGPLADFARAGTLAVALHTFLYLVVPIAVPPRAFETTGWCAQLLAWEGQREASGAGALPSFHVTWALLTAVLGARSFPRATRLWGAWACAIAVTCITTGMHAVADVVAGAFTFVLVQRRRAVWSRLRRWAERTANSLRTWRLGPFRLFVHAGYAGSAAAVTVFTMGTFVGTGELWAVVFVCFAAVVGGALWAQWVEGASVSLRPFGYYGSVVGAVLALLILPWLSVDPWPLAGGICVAAPFAQAIGRLRCLVQGCCHGRPAPVGVGIVCTAPLSRVVRIAGLGGVPLHPTQLYSLLWNVPCGVVLLRCAQLGQPPTVVAGLYLLLNGLGRFVEEAFRGEPQARHWGGLVEYQYYAMISVALGAAVTCVPSVWPTPAGTSPALLLVTAAMALFVAGAMGVDFPDSDRRFARLLK